jgi:hypothetical protein
MQRIRMMVGVTLLGLGAAALRFPEAGNPIPESARLRRHFAAVERELLARDASALSPAQRAARREQVRLLRRYAAEGNFPRNEFLPGQVPFFRDSRGNLCAMAFLVAASGRGDIVDHVVRTRNNAYLPELADEPGLAEWLDQHGLTLAEAARIQPTYGGIDHNRHNDPTAGYVAATLAAGTLSTISIIWNARSMDRLAGHRDRGLGGVAFGAVSLGLGLAYAGDGDRRGAFGVVNLALGSTAMILGVRALMARPTHATSKSSRLTLAPVARAGAHPRLGFGGSFRF